VEQVRFFDGWGGKKIAPAASNGAKEFICCQGEQGSKGEKRYFAGVSAPSAYAGRASRNAVGSKAFCLSEPRRRARKRANGRLQQEAPSDG